MSRSSTRTGTSEETRSRATSSTTVYEECILPIERLHRGPARLTRRAVPQGTGRRAPGRSCLAIAQILTHRRASYLSSRGASTRSWPRFYRDLRELLSKRDVLRDVRRGGAVPGLPATSPRWTRSSRPTITSGSGSGLVAARRGPSAAGSTRCDPSSWLNRYDLDKRELRERIAPISGTVGRPRDEPRHRGRRRSRTSRSRPTATGSTWSRQRRTARTRCSGRDGSGTMA